MVHGGPQFEDPVVITPEVQTAIAGVSPFAPLQDLLDLGSAARMYVPIRTDGN